jgi:putative ABC transport system ATP-binding protein
MAVLEACELYRFFHIGDEETAALRGVSLSLDPGEIVVIMGPSGSGKSTLMNCLTGLDEPDAGFVNVNGTRMSRRPETEKARMRAQSISILMQSGNLFAHLSVAENLRFQMLLSGSFNADRSAILLRDVGISHRANALPSQLSGGETARAGLAVALAGDPHILIADEPTAEVDAKTENKIIGQFEARRAAGGATLIATHSEALAYRADRVIRLLDGRVLDV